MECKYCKEDIKDGAIKCKHCGSMLDDSDTSPKIIKEEPKSNEEKVFYSANDGAIKVTNTRFITFGQTYSLANISSVKMGYEDKNNAALICIILGFITAISVSLFGLVLIGIGIWLFTMKTYKVIINTSGGETDALLLKEEAVVEKIVSKLNEAIIHRG